jgi:hypothetical protein
LGAYEWNIQSPGSLISQQEMFHGRDGNLRIMPVMRRSAAIHSQNLKNAISENVTSRICVLGFSLRSMTCEQPKGQSEFAEAYQRFVALSGGHVGIVGPYLAKFAAMIN